MLQSVSVPLFRCKQVEVQVLRLDLLDCDAPGNKFFKLRCNLEQAREQGYSTLASYGGAHSNHIHALAATGRKLGFRTIGVIRGERATVISPTLEDAERWGMQLIFLNRAEFRKLRQQNLWSEWLAQQGLDAFVIPEGAANRLGVMGCRQIAELLPSVCDRIVLASATGGTLAGIAAGVADGVAVEGVVVLKNEPQLADDVRLHLASIEAPDRNNWSLHHGFHFGGYAKVTGELARFIEQFQVCTDLPLDPIYTAKMFYALCQRVAEGCYPEGSRLVAVHTGGLQGVRAMQSRLQALAASSSDTDHFAHWFGDA